MTILIKEDEVSFLENPSLAKNIISDMVGFTEMLRVESEEAYKKLTSIYRQAREWKKAIDAKRKELVEPFRTETARINDRAKELTEPLDRVIEVANAKTSGYLELLEKKKKEEEDKIRAAADIFDVGTEIYIPPMEKTLRGDGTTTITKTTKEFRVLDLSKVPLKYLMVDESKVKQDIKLGILNIEGLEIYEETSTTLRMR